MRYDNPQGVTMAETHHYRRGQHLEASGYEDPIVLFYRGEWLEKSHPDRERCPDCDYWREQAERSKQLLP